LKLSGWAGRACGILALVWAVVVLSPLSVAQASNEKRTWSPARNSPCDRPHRGRFVYHYPIKPFDRQHPIRGNFGDPRTLVKEGEAGSDTPRTPGSYSFHNGVDISAATGTAVYPVVSGTARIGYADEVIVSTGDNRVFQYFHIRPTIKPGRHVIAYRTLIGHTLPEYLHVHLSELDGFHVHNPADPGHLEPYHNHTIPIVRTLEASTAGGHTIEENDLHGLVRFAADALDVPPLPLPGEWLGVTVTPALIRWRLAGPNGRMPVPWTTAADFRRTEPPNRDFWQVYGAGTYQNFPVFGHHYLFGLPGRYLFELTHRPLDTRRLANGAYQITVSAADVCGNTSTLSVPVRIHNNR
jgi:hypothetical protein